MRPVSSSDLERIEAALVRLARRINDPRGNAAINAEAGVDIERAGAVMLARVEELQPARLSHLAEASGIDVSTASRQVARLVDDGLVEQAPDPDDGRARVHQLTAEGMEVRARLAAARKRWLDDVLSGFTPEERAQLADLFTRFLDALAERAGLG